MNQSTLRHTLRVAADADLGLYAAPDTRVYVFQVQMYTQAAPGAVIE